MEANLVNRGCALMVTEQHGKHSGSIMSQAITNRRKRLHTLYRSGYNTAVDVCFKSLLQV